jgi:hypothetical protein
MCDRDEGDEMVQIGWSYYPRRVLDSMDTRIFTFGPIDDTPLGLLLELIFCGLYLLVLGLPFILLPLLFIIYIIVD